MAAPFTEPEQYASSIGFALFGVFGGAVASLLMVRWVLLLLQRERNDRRLVRTLENIGVDSLAALSRLTNAPPFEGFGINVIWPAVLNGDLDFKGRHFHDVWYGVVRMNAVSSSDVQVALTMVTRSVGRMYASFDLFDHEFDMTSDLVDAQLLLETAYRSPGAKDRWWEP